MTSPHSSLQPHRIGGCEQCIARYCCLSVACYRAEGFVKREECFETCLQRFAILVHCVSKRFIGVFVHCESRRVFAILLRCALKRFECETELCAKQI